MWIVITLSSVIICGIQFERFLNRNIFVMEPKVKLQRCSFKAALRILKNRNRDVSLGSLLYRWLKDWRQQKVNHYLNYITKHQKMNRWMSKFTIWIYIVSHKKLQLKRSPVGVWKDAYSVAGCRLPCRMQVQHDSSSKDICSQAWICRLIRRRVKPNSKDWLTLN